MFLLKKATDVLSWRRGGVLGVLGYNGLISPSNKNYKIVIKCFIFFFYWLLKAIWQIKLFLICCLYLGHFKGGCCFFKFCTSVVSYRNLLVILFCSYGYFFAVKEVSLLDQGAQGRQSIFQLEQVRDFCFVMVFLVFYACTLLFAM